MLDDERKNDMKKKLIAAVLACLLVVLTLASCNQEEARSVRSAEIDENGQLVLTYTDGTQSVLGTVKGADGRNGQDGADGKDGIDGKDGVNGKDGADGKNGAAGVKGNPGAPGEKGETGEAGRGIASVSMSEDGNLKVTYSDGKAETVELLGSLYLFGGMMGKGDATAAWALYNGGLLVLAGNGATVDYAAGGTPWHALIPMLTAVYVDYSNGLELGEHVLDGIDADKIFVSSVWIDMTVEASLYEEANTESRELAKLPLGTELIYMEESGAFTKVQYGSQIGYVETKYIARTNGSVVYEACDCTVTVINEAGANLRTFPDATAASEQNIVCKVSRGTELRCTGVSVNGNWLRIEYDDVTGQKQTLYCMKKLVQLPTEA